MVEFKKIKAIFHKNSVIEFGILKDKEEGMNMYISLRARTEKDKNDWKAVTMTFSHAEVLLIEHLLLKILDLLTEDMFRKANI